MFAVLVGGAIQHHFAAILRVSSFVSSLAADRRAGASSNTPKFGPVCA